MTTQEIKNLIDQKIAGQGNQVDLAGALPKILGGIVEQMERREMLETPLTFEAVDEEVTITLRAYNDDIALDVEVSLDGGATWEKKTSSADGTLACTLAAGEKAMFRGDNAAYGFYDEEEGEAINACTFDVQGRAYAYGNVMSLLNSVGYASQKAVGPYAFAYLFGDYDGEVTSEIIDHPDLPLLLPATTIARYCYKSMFQNCTSLTEAPELPATTLATGCYKSMFLNCTSLGYVKCLATDISAANSHNGWLQNVAAIGTFVKADEMEDWPSGASGIPAGWTVKNASEV